MHKQIKNNNYFITKNIYKEKKIFLYNNEKINSRSSYTSWINNIQEITNLNNKFKDYEENNSIVDTPKISGIEQYINMESLNDPNPLSTFPKGTIAGTFFHKILERFDFEGGDQEKLVSIIREELSLNQYDFSLLNEVKEGINRLLYSPLGKELQNKRLVDIPNQKIIKEMKYDLPLSSNGKVIDEYDIAKCFEFDEDKDFGKNYSRQVKDLKINSKGFHIGSIDCLIPIGNNVEDTKWWVIDWKSNYLSENDSADCKPSNYNQKNMREEMIKHHYPLQAHLYLLALHRFLKWRLKGIYKPDLHLGGYAYIFLRGIPKIPSKSISDFEQIPGIFSSNAPLERIAYLDHLFKYGK